MGFDSDSDSDFSERLIEATRFPAASGINEGASTSAPNEDQDCEIDSDDEGALATAIKLNNELIECYSKLEQELIKRLSICEKKLKCIRSEVEKSKAPSNSRSKEYYKYSACGMPYFKLARSFCPPNKDTVLMKEADMYHSFDLQQPIAWTSRDRSLLEKTALEVYRSNLIAKISNQVTQIRRELKSCSDKEEILKLKNKIKELKDKIRTVEGKALKEVAPPPGEEEVSIDWEEVAVSLDGRHSSGECCAMWNYFMNPSICKKPWTSDEHRRLQLLVTSNRAQDWERIAKELKTNRSGYQCFVYFKSRVEANQDAGRRWTATEDKRLLDAVEECRIGEHVDWGKLSHYIPYRSKAQIYNRWMVIKQPDVQRGRFTPQEDEVLVACIKKFGRNFTVVKKYLPHRNVKQLQHRIYVLQQKQSSPWTRRQDAQLLKLIAQYEDSTNPFATVAQHFPDKTRNSIRIRVTTLKRWKKLHPDSHLWLAPRRTPKRRPVPFGDGPDECAINLGAPAPQQSDATKLQNKIREVDSEIYRYFEKSNMTEEDFRKDAAEEEHPLKLPDRASHNLKNILIHLRADLIKPEQKTSSSRAGNVSQKALRRAYLCNIPQTPPPVKKIRTYSRKNKSVVLSNSGVADVWVNTPCVTSKYVLPPNFETLIALRKIMFMNMQIGRVNNAFMEPTIAKNKVFQTMYKKWLIRFHTIFSWPLIMSNIKPRIENFFNDDAENSKSTNNNGHTKKTKLDLSTPINDPTNEAKPNDQ